MAELLTALRVANNISRLLECSLKVANAAQALPIERNLPRQLELMRLEVLALHNVLQSLPQILETNPSAASLIPESAILTCASTLKQCNDLFSRIVSRKKPSLSPAFYLMIKHDKLRSLKEELDRQKATFSLILSSYMRYLPSGLKLRSSFQVFANYLLSVGVSIDLRKRIEQMEKANLQQMQQYEELLHQSDHQKRREVLGWVSTYNFEAKQQDLRSIRFPGTCTWIFSQVEYLEWRDHGTSLLRITGARKSSSTFSKRCALIHSMKLGLESPFCGNRFTPASVFESTKLV